MGHKGLHSPPSSSTNVDEVVSQRSWEAHFLFRPQDFPRQAPPGWGRHTRHLVPPLLIAAQWFHHCGQHCGSGEQGLREATRSLDCTTLIVQTPTRQVGGTRGQDVVDETKAQRREEARGPGARSR